MNSSYARPISWALGGISFILATLQYFVVQVVVAGAWPHNYSWNDNYISDLGNTACGRFVIAGHASEVCSPLHAMMNGSFVAAGVLTIAGTCLLWRLWPQTGLARAGLILWLIAGMGKVIVGLVPENTNIFLHTFGAMNLPIGSVAVLLLSLSVRRAHPVLYRLGRIVSLLGLVAGSLFTLMEYSGYSVIPGLGAGGLERIAGYPSNIWMLGIGLVSFARLRRGSLSSSPVAEPKPVAARP
jgi:hypothetical membrane protein